MKKRHKKIIGGLAGTTTGLLTLYIINIVNMVKNMSFLVTQVTRVPSSLLSSILGLNLKVVTQVTNPSRTSAYLKAMFLDLYVEVRQNQYVLIGSINEPKINTKIQAKNNSFVNVTVRLDNVAIAKMIVNGFGVIVETLKNGRIPKLRFKGNVLINSIRKNIDIIYEG